MVHNYIRVNIGCYLIHGFPSKTVVSFQNNRATICINAVCTLSDPAYQVLAERAVIWIFAWSYQDTMSISVFMHWSISIVSKKPLNNVVRESDL